MVLPSVGSTTRTESATQLTNLIIPHLFEWNDNKQFFLSFFLYLASTLLFCCFFFSVSIIGVRVSRAKNRKWYSSWIGWTAYRTADWTRKYYYHVNVMPGPIHINNKSVIVRWLRECICASPPPPNATSWLRSVTFFVCSFVQFLFAFLQFSYSKLHIQKYNNNKNTTI